jgi:hypothetical protein
VAYERVKPTLMKRSATPYTGSGTYPASFTMVTTGLKPSAFSRGVQQPGTEAHNSTEVVQASKMRRTIPPYPYGAQ